MSQMNPKEVFYNTAFSVQLPYIAGHSLLVEVLQRSHIILDYLQALMPKYAHNSRKT